ncbi:MAG: hypothetical protein Q7K55_04035 [Candidatus Levybacteria bacterium]|nr:hypothetical protein [Candidatus Levybacteria bacterium]
MTDSEHPQPPGLGSLHSSSGTIPLSDPQRRDILTHRLKQMQEAEEQELPIEKSHSRIDRFNLFAKALQSQGSIYYPGSHTDVSPSAADGFTGRQITYVDPNPKVIQALQKEGYNAVLADAHTYAPGKVDLLLLLNFYAQEPLSYVVPQGYVICNKYYQDGSIFSDMFGQKDFEFTGALVKSNNKQIVFDTADLEKYKQVSDLTKQEHDENLFVFRRKEVT